MAADDLQTLQPVDRARMEVDEVRRLDGGAIVRTRFHGRGRDGIEVERPFVHVWSFRDGRIAAVRSYGSWEDAARATGL